MFTQAEKLPPSGCQNTTKSLPPNFTEFPVRERERARARLQNGFGFQRVYGWKNVPIDDSWKQVQT